MNGRIFQLNCSNGGVPKRSVREAVVTQGGMVGDKQAKTLIHGGPDRALCLYSLEHILRLQAEGHPIYPGSVGENITVVGLDWSTIEPGDQLALGDEVLVEISKYTTPCKTIAASFIDGAFNRILQKTHPGESRLYARILQAGRLAVGQPVRVLERV